MLVIETLKCKMVSWILSNTCFWSLLCGMLKSKHDKLDLKDYGLCLGLDKQTNFDTCFRNMYCYVVKLVLVEIGYVVLTSTIFA